MTPAPCLHQRRHVHGTYAAYKSDGCRCYPCAAACSDYMRTREMAMTAGTWQPWVDAEPARRHVLDLGRAGIGWRTVAEAAGVSTGVVGRLLYGDRGRAPSRRIRPASEAALLAVTVDALRGGALVDGTGTVRRVRALIAAGWTGPTLAGRLGRQYTWLAKLITGAGDGRVMAATERAVRALYDELWDLAPPEGVDAVRARRRAVRLGWPPPLAWDDDTIDDPDAAPCTPTDGRWRRAELVAEVLHIADETPETVAARVGLSSESIERSLWRAGRGDLVARVKANRAEDVVS